MLTASTVTAWSSPSACPVCAQPVAATCTCPVGSGEGCRCVARCRVCGHRFRVEPEAALVEGSLYGQGYHDRRKTEGTAGFPMKEYTFRLHLDLLRRARPDLVGRRLLDVGCATGDFLAKAQRAGLEVAGVELSPHAAARATERGLTVCCGRIEDVTDGPYDVVHSSHVLEHVPDVRAFARRVAAMLRPGGLALIEVPNEFDDVLSTLRRSRRPGRVVRPRSPHLHFFSPRSLRRLFAATGLVERDFLTYSHPRLAAPGMAIGERLRWVTTPNVLLRIGDTVQRGRNLVLLLARAVA